MNKLTSISLKTLKARIEEYRTTVDALLCFVSLTTWGGEEQKKGSHYSFGRHMKTSSGNPVSPNDEVTPDIAIQVSEAEAYICEAKIDLPKDQKYWASELEQLQKYDDDLTGWWTHDETIDAHDLILLIDISRSSQLAKYVEMQYAKKSPFKKMAGFIGFNRYQRVDENILFQLEWGGVTEPRLRKRLEDHVAVPLEKVIASFGNRKFYDQKPEPEYLMEVMWSHLFTEKMSNATYDDGLKAWPFEI
jgi:hypothetical protein